MSTNDDQVKEQTALAKDQADERVRLQEEQNRQTTDEERTRLQEESDRAHAESEAAQKEALEKENAERAVNAKLDH